MAQKKEHSNLIKEHLKKRGITQTWLAKEIGMSFSITNAYVCNRKQPNLVTIFKVADLLNVSPKELIEQWYKSESFLSKVLSTKTGIYVFVMNEVTF